jgi:hypothetical protein
MMDDSGEVESEEDEVEGQQTSQSIEVTLHDSDQGGLCILRRHTVLSMIPHRCYPTAGPCRISNP